nr:hypothetical protein [Desulfuromonadales bacterium]
IIGEILDQIEMEIGQIMLYRRQQEWCQIRSDRRRHAERTGADERAFMSRGGHLQCVHVMQNFPRLNEDLFADFRQLDPTFGALENL